MGVVRTMARQAEAPTVAEAVAAFLATLDHPETAGTRRVYASTLRQLREHLGAEVLVAVLDEPETASTVAGWFVGRWGPAAPATFNRNLDAIRSAAGYWRDQGWIVGDPTRAIRRRGRAPDRTRALSRAVVEELLGREDLGLRERVLWRMLYETAARASEVLALDVDTFTSTCSGVVFASTASSTRPSPPAPTPCTWPSSPVAHDRQQIHGHRPKPPRRPAHALIGSGHDGPIRRPGRRGRGGTRGWLGLLLAGRPRQ